MTKTLPITQAREELTTIVDNAKRKLNEYVITVNGSRVAAIISIDEYDSWKETNEIVADKALMRAIKQGERDMINEDFVTLKEFEKELGL
ncbi:hypothetical protein A2690_01620 [Candidatus Roizmanbacteria bacterium RIFCSPHIGHO2_01_FULL_39_12b]|uniref:Antitoxin n=1 Tax=Candidatus Roizmanbacteria bacterium RIFCSPHIGHO2_01_FULL_39_12b TaxID=1802030 RepID=A0A1F7GB41_9BACT|nr:MAG: hypothetical protein A2690_01620 [Candidatus Roizmanbacteria bacterium RIFCSPHIGHO2_01_FULL_39_12b]OGK46121.1 MAG: hypothetical protein A3B46_02865 [Candidatus Roizmanbacteria bacterium RIFCSPLOWO2_01_FULL_39_19]